MSPILSCFPKTRGTNDYEIAYRNRSVKKLTMPRKASIPPPAPSSPHPHGVSASDTTTAAVSYAPPLIAGRGIPRVSGKVRNHAWGRRTRTTAATKMSGEEETTAFSPSAFIRLLDASTAGTYDEWWRPAPALMRDERWAAFGERWAAAVEASGGGTEVAQGFAGTDLSAKNTFTKQQVLLSICSYPPEVFDGTAGTRAEAQAVNAAAEAAAAVGLCKLNPVDP
jgi:hypothetical protein